MNPITSKQQKGESQDSPFCCFLVLSNRYVMHSGIRDDIKNEIQYA